MTVHISPVTVAEAEAIVARWQDRFPKVLVYLSADSAPTRALRYLGLALWQEGNVEEAATVLLNASYWDPDNAAILAELGSATLAAGRPDEAMSHFIASLQLDDSQVQVWLNLGYLCKAAGNIEFATMSFEKALTIEPLSSEAVAGLGMIHFEAGEYARASSLLKSSVERGVNAPAVDACLGQALYLQGLFAEARIAFERAALACPQEQKIVTKYAEARFVETVIFGSVDDAIAEFRRILGDDLQQLDAASKTAFQLCCAFGHADAAQRLGTMILKEQPDDAMVRYHLEALTGQKYDRAPRDYLVACFDHYAPKFEQHLVEVLRYNVPKTCETLIRKTGRSFSSILDVGCGTGLFAPYLASFGGDLTGVDLAPRMLEKAHERGLYSRLVQADALDFLASNERLYDLVACLDTLIYFGDLSDMFRLVAERLLPGGLFAFSHETSTTVDFGLYPTGRFKHSPAYIASLSAQFREIYAVDTILRLDANKPVPGRVILLERI